MIHLETQLVFHIFDFGIYLFHFRIHMLHLVLCKTQNATYIFDKSIYKLNSTSNKLICKRYTANYVLYSYMPYNEFNLIDFTNYHS